MVAPLYVDTSALVAVLFDEPGAAKVKRALRAATQVFAANLLEAELRSAAARERVDAVAVDAVLAGLSWVCPSRSLGSECANILRVGYLRGADLWHLACASYLSQVLAPVAILTLDDRQREVAVAAGLRLARV